MPARLEERPLTARTSGGCQVGTWLETASEGFLPLTLMGGENQFSPLPQLLPRLADAGQPPSFHFAKKGPPL